MKNTFQAVSIALFFGGLGLAVGSILLAETSTDKSMSGPATPGASIESVQRLNKTVSKLEAELQRINLRLDGLANKPAIATELPSPEDIESNLDPKILPAMARKIAELEQRIEKDSRPKTAAELLAEFHAALRDKNGRAAREALIALAELNPPDYPAVLEAWGAMNEADWLGLSRRQRGGWGSAGLFHWALSTSNLGLSEELTKEFQTLALRSLRAYEQDQTKLAETYALFLANQPIPAALTAEQQESQGGRGGRGRRGGRGERGGRGGAAEAFGLFGGRGGESDPFRSALAMLSRTRDPAASSALASVLGSSSNPSDVRLTALRGLARQRDDSAAQQAIQNAVNDSDPKVAEAAQLYEQTQNSPVTGLLITSVTPDSEAARAGIAVGHIITSCNGTPVKSTRDLSRIARSIADGENIPVVLYDNGATRTVSVKKARRFGLNGRSVTANGG